MKVNELTVGEMAEACSQAISYCRDRPPDQLMLVNFVPQEHRLELQVPVYPRASLPVATRFFIVHVVYSRSDGTSVVHVYEHGHAAAFVQHTVAFGH